ncbi:MAG: cysteine synthase [Candidatus Poribacteria bacterium]|nr:MAG: cysteine synthase [Candidatus Poribacteria bacterium]
MRNRICPSVLEAIGETPLIALNRLRPVDGAQVLLKLEYYAPGGSIKDRIALQILEDAERAGRLKPGDVVVELTSGNTGIGLAIACAIKGYRMIAVMSEGNSVERRRLLEAFGAEVVLVPQAGSSEPGKVSGEDLQRVEQKAQELTRKLKAFRADQFNNPSNARAHELGTGREIWEQTEGRVNAFVASVGTGGSFVGIARALKARSPAVRCYVVEPETAPYFSQGRITNPRHRIQGTGYGIYPAFWDESLVDGYLTVSDEEAIETARRLARREGILGGFSTGANVAAALQLAARLPAEATVVTLAPDTGMKYLSTDLWP